MFLNTLISLGIKETKQFNLNLCLVFSSVDLFMPKISISASSSLGDILKNMGMVNAFIDTADFFGISEETKLKVSKVQYHPVHPHCVWGLKYAVIQAFIF